ncbi:MAG: HAMP domain-containing protein [Pseudomonadota bacterium]
MAIRPNRLKLGTGIATFAIFLVFLASVLIVGFNFYQGTKETHLRTEELVDSALGRTEERLQGLIAPVAPALNAIAVLSRHADLAAENGEALRTLALPILRRSPQIASIYVGTEAGKFTQIVSFIGKGESFREPYKVPDAAAFALVTSATQGEGAGERSTRPVLPDGQFTGGVSDEQTSYDPRKRPWYAPALASDGAHRTAPYVFAKSRKPGLTLSRALAGGNKGVAGIDLDLRTLKAFLISLKITPGTRLAIVTRDGQILAHSHYDGVAVREASGTVVNLHLLGLEESGDRVLPQMITAANGGEGLRDITVDEVRYLGRSIDIAFGSSEKEQLIIAVPWNELVGPLVSARDKSIIITLGIAVCVMAVAFFVAHQIARPIEIMTEEARKIGNLDFAESAGSRSFVYEVDQLGEAVQDMKSRLSAARHYLPRALVRQLLETGAAGREGGERRSIAIAVCELDGLDALADQPGVEEVMPQVSGCLDGQTAAFLLHKGAIAGQAVNALTVYWNAPVPDENRTRNACLAVLAARERLAGLNAGWNERGQPALQARYGLHSGSVLIGNAGSADSLQYTALGKSARLAPRLARLNEVLGTEILATEAVELSAGEEFLWKPLGELSPDGFGEPVLVYELVGLKAAVAELDHATVQPAEVLERTAMWTEAMNLFLSGEWEEAAPLFERYSEGQSDDDLAAFYLNRISAGPSGPASPTGLEAFERWITR